MQSDLIALQDTGLDRLGELAAGLRARYAIDHPGAREIVDWLDGGYRITGNRADPMRARRLPRRHPPGPRGPMDHGTEHGRIRDWNFPDKMRPRAEHAHSASRDRLRRRGRAAPRCPAAAFTAPMLGTDRQGNGVVIGEGLVLTIGYLITEATNVWLTTRAGVVVAGYPFAYDQPSGFGLVRALGPLPASGATPRARGRGRAGDTVFVISHGGCRVTRCRRG
ncbi:MAG: hypothetical protein U0527_06615 [Candidatus Eisenbacteria bacterium]